SGATSTWAVTNGTGFAVSSAPSGSITVVGKSGHVGIAVSGLTVGLVGLGSVATFTVGDFSAVYNKDHFAFGNTTIDAVSGLHAAGSLALDASGFVDAVGTIDTTIDTAAASFALTVTNPSPFIPYTTLFRSSGATSTWAVTNGTGFAVSSAPS